MPTCCLFQELFLQLAVEVTARCTASQRVTQIADVSATAMSDQADEEADSAQQQAARAAHALLLALCTDPSHGLAGGGVTAEGAPDGDDIAGAAGSNPAGVARAGS